MRIRDNLVRLYSQMTEQTKEQITIDLNRDNFMCAVAMAASSHALSKGVGLFGRAGVDSFCTCLVSQGAPLFI